MIHDPIYPTAPGHRGVSTSIEAADAMAPVSGRLRQIARRSIMEAGASGLTTDELAKVTGFERSSIQPRTSELKLLHLIKDSGLRRRNANGKRAIVWVAVSDEERAALIAANDGGANA